MLRNHLTIRGWLTGIRSTRVCFALGLWNTAADRSNPRARWISLPPGTRQNSLRKQPNKHMHREAETQALQQTTSPQATQPLIQHTVTHTRIPAVTN